ncbi:peptide N-acetyl-beta-D-glucosaminyl asparaginase amidase A-domain-containing protein [Apodospora peruviana]|uniref:Peptide N-acetyl-beta-D-glucosaminyl asparaginase amidase A-domain-containing protein n=1 Tax=Apodospora peruviana TaxID=516989 RepID=A0AAE0IHT8_9PEZI|nr:peptide N-acetyl-beta-D-glucosaminyl asparaginase amidase A-domain-containing protein [Apodospora peruviana]
MEYRKQQPQEPDDLEKRLPQIYEDSQEDEGHRLLPSSHLPDNQEETSLNNKHSRIGLITCIAILFITGLLIFSGRVEAPAPSGGIFCPQRGGISSPSVAGDLDGFTTGAEPTRSSPSRQHRFKHTVDHVVNVLGPQHEVEAAAESPSSSSKFRQSRQEIVTSSLVSTVSAAPPAATATRTVLQNFEVAQPVLMPYGASDSDGSTDDDGSLSEGDCKVLLMRRDFAWSYNDPFIGMCLLFGPLSFSCTFGQCKVNLYRFLHDGLNHSCSLPLCVCVCKLGSSWQFPMDYILSLESNNWSYTPPAGCQFNRVVINFTVVSVGRQYDRLAIMYLGDTEIWRTSTAEPTSPPGIRWTYLKDMTEYLYLWKQPQKVIFDLGNLINDKYTGIFNTTLTATFFMSDVVTDAAPPSDLIIPISARQSANNSVSQFTVPAQEATNTISDFPRNARRAVFSVSANGQASEEFWWSNVPQSDVFTFNATAGQFPGYSPFREVQVLIDDQLAGVYWPFPVIFTGGVSPALHRPIASPDAFDLKEHEIDITPFLPSLCDGKPHMFSIIIAGLNDDGIGHAELTDPVGESWYVTGKIFVWLDADSNSITTGGLPTIQSLPPAVSLTRSLGKTANGTNSSLTYVTAVQRSLLISALVVSAKGQDTASWSQTLEYSNKGYVSNLGYNQLNDMTITGNDEAAGFDVSYRTRYRYPLFANQSYETSEQGNLTIWGHVVQGKELEVGGKGNVFPTGLEAFSSKDRKYEKSVLRTVKEGQAWFFQTGDGMNSSGFGDAHQVFRFGGLSDRGVLSENEESVELYWRNVSAVNGSVVYDFKRIAGGQDEAVVAGSGGGGRAIGLFADVPSGRGRTGPRMFMGRNGQR